jgi:hypothetical protein
LVTAEIAFSLCLVVAAALLVRSYDRLQAENRGFSATGVLTAQITVPDTKYTAAQQRAEFFRTLVTGVGDVPGITKAAAVRFLPMNGVASPWSVSIPGQASQSLPAFHHIVTPGYFEVMKIPLLAGRSFDEHDTADRGRVDVISATAARRYFPDDPHPLGRSLRILDTQTADWEVVGIVDDVRNIRPDLAPLPQIYVRMEQSPVSGMTLVIRTNESPVSSAGPSAVSWLRSIRTRPLLT